MHCHRCGNEVPKGNTTCGKCGYSQTTEQNTSPQPSVETQPTPYQPQQQQVPTGSPQGQGPSSRGALWISLAIVVAGIIIAAAIAIPLAISNSNSHKTTPAILDDLQQSKDYYESEAVKAQVRTCQANQRTVDGAIQSYQAADANQSYPDSLARMTEAGVQTLKKVPTCPSGGKYIWTTSPDGTDPPYISCKVHPARDGY